MKIRFSLLLLMAATSLYGQQAKPMVMPTQEVAFEIKQRQLLEMGENALATKDYQGALAYFLELQGKLPAESAGRIGSDRALVSALLAETCLALPQQTDVVVDEAKGTRVNVLRLAGQLLEAPLNEAVSEEVSIYHTFIRGRYCQQSGEEEKALKILQELWGTDGREKRLARLGDLHNWVLLVYLQTLNVQADKKTGEEAENCWRQVVQRSAERIADLAVKLPKKSEEELAREEVRRQGDAKLRRSVRQDALEAEFVRLRACALLELERYPEAKVELEKTCLSLYAAERSFLRLCCLASLSEKEEAMGLYERCRRENPLTRDTSPLLKREWCRALWALVYMCHRGGEYAQAGEFLEQLEPMLRPEDRLNWLMMRLTVLKGALEEVLAPDGSVPPGRKPEVELIYNNCLKYSALLPDICQPAWTRLVEGLSAELKNDYYQLLGTVLQSLGGVQAKLGNMNSAMDLYGRLGASKEVSAEQRYQACLALGDIAVSDIRRSIDAYKQCEALPGIAAAQKSEALYRAVQRALKEMERMGRQKAEGAAMGKEAEQMMIRLCMEYNETEAGVDAAFTLAEYYYGLPEYQSAAAYYEKYYMGPRAQLEKRDMARLRWARCWRLLAEGGLSQKLTVPQCLAKAQMMLQLLRKTEVPAEVRRQAYLESYRVAFAQGDADTGMKMLDELVAWCVKDAVYPQELWVAHYERMLNHYQHGRQEQALRCGNEFVKQRELSQLPTVPWERETWLLLGDVQAAAGEWRQAGEWYLKLEKLPLPGGKKDKLFLYGMYEAAFCQYMNGSYDLACQQLEAHFQTLPAGEKEMAYKSAMLLGDVLQAQGKFEEARGHYERAQGVYGQTETYKSNLAKCRQGEMLLALAEKMFKAPERVSHQADMARLLERSGEIFASLLENRTVAGTAGGVENDHYFDLFLRAQYRLGECYELTLDAKGEGGQKEKALWCYKRVCDYFAMRQKNGEALRSSQYYIKSLERRIRLLTGGSEPVSYDTMDTVARLYEAYAEMKLPGSVMAAERAAQIRRTWK